MAAHMSQQQLPVKRHAPTSESTPNVISQPQEIVLALAALMVVIAFVAIRTLAHVAALSPVELGGVAVVAGAYWVLWVGKYLGAFRIFERPESRSRAVVTRHDAAKSHGRLEGVTRSDGRRRRRRR